MSLRKWLHKRIRHAGAFILYSTHLYRLKASRSYFTLDDIKSATSKHLRSPLNFVFFIVLPILLSLTHCYANDYNGLVLVIDFCSISVESVI